MYRPTIRTTDLASSVANDVGSPNHDRLIDLIYRGVSGPDDEEVLVLYENHHTEKEIGDILGVSQQAISYRMGNIRRRANRCFNGSRCGCRTLPSRRS